MLLNPGDIIRESTQNQWASAWRIESFLASGRHTRLYVAHSLAEGLEEQRAILKLVKYDPRRCGDHAYIQQARSLLKRECETLTHFSPRLPEPVDFFFSYNAQDPFEGFGVEALRSSEPVLVQSYVQGSSLASLMEIGGAPPASAEVLLLSLARVCSFLEELHASGRGWLFWNLCPEHVLVDPHQDFEPRFVGCSHFRMLKEGLAVHNPISQQLHLGIPEGGYAAPEVISAGRCDPRVDVYSVGCMLFHLFTGTDPRDLAEDIFARGSFPTLTPPDAYNSMSDAWVSVLMTPTHAHRFCTELRLSMERFCRRNLKGLGIHRARIRKTILKATHPDPDQRFASPLELRDTLLGTLSRSRRVAWPHL